MYMAEDRQEHVERARTTVYQRQIRLLCITWLPVEGSGGSRGNTPALRCLSAGNKHWAHAASSPSARATGCDYEISVAYPLEL